MHSHLREWLLLPLIEFYGILDIWGFFFLPRPLSLTQSLITSVHTNSLILSLIMHSYVRMLLHVIIPLNIKGHTKERSV